MLVTKASVLWAEAHAAPGRGGIWRCVDHHADLQVEWIRYRLLGSPKQRTVGILFCPVCDGDPIFPPDGTEIRPEDIVDSPIADQYPPGSEQWRSS